MFAEICAGIGAWVQRTGHILRVGWSNDHLLKQARPEVDGLESVVRNPDGTLGANPEHCRFLFEETADYHAMRGFLESAVVNPTSAAHVELDISEPMLNGSRERNTLAWTPVRERVVAGTRIADHINTGVVRRYEIDGRRDYELFRSKYLMNMLTDTGAREVDLVVAVGGGKASGTFYQTALERMKLLPLPYCGGEAQRTILRSYARRNSRALERITYVLGHEMPEVEQDYAPDEVGGLLRILDNVEKFFSYPYRVFVAFPYGRTAEQRATQNHLFGIIERAIATVSASAPNRYPHASAVRIDQHIFGTREIHREMWSMIRNCGVIMGELTPIDPGGAPNPNVFYELGFADGVFNDKPHLLTARHGTEVPFDVGNKLIYYWSDLEHFERVCVEQFRRIFDRVHNNE
ncbi:hypothetical protein [Streptomyces sp. NPDC096339]|uniref:hypothetical protein n=1 Tax=Streptomyces sp. NPDC096339 TaxID=3366086 RepID=UPI003805F707